MEIFADLLEIVKLAKQYGTCTAVDDAHGEGVLGRYEQEIVDHFDLHGQVEFGLGTLSKAFGFIIGQKELIDFLR